MKKRTAALSLVLIGPTLIAGCYSRNNTSARNEDCDPNKEDCNNRRGGGYYGGGGIFYGGGASRARSNANRNNGGSSSVDSGGFGSTGRSYSSGS